MALRNILTEGNHSLYKVCRPYGEFNQRLAVLLDDMAETMKNVLKNCKKVEDDCEIYI